MSSLKDIEREKRVHLALQGFFDEYAFKNERTGRFFIEDASFEDFQIDLEKYIETIYEEGVAHGIIERMNYENS